MVIYFQCSGNPLGLAYIGIGKRPLYMDIFGELILNPFTVRARWKVLKHACSGEPALKTCAHGRYPANIQSEFLHTYAKLLSIIYTV